jgi:hypothetical protein
VYEALEKLHNPRTTPSMRKVNTLEVERGEQNNKNSGYLRTNFTLDSKMWSGNKEITEGDVRRRNVQEHKIQYKRFMVENGVHKVSPLCVLVVLLLIYFVQTNTIYKSALYLSLCRCLPTMGYGIVRNKIIEEIFLFMGAYHSRVPSVRI